MPHYAALVTLAAILFYFYVGGRVASARRRFGVPAPQTTGNPDFERVFRVQANTLEWMPIFLPALWLFALYVSDAGAAVLGLVWIVGRIAYMFGYEKAAQKREVGFTIQAIAGVALWLGATIAVVLRLAHGG